MPEDYELREAYATHLQGFYWDTYLTVTFKHTRHDGTNSVSAVWNRLPFEPSRGFFAVEHHKLDGIHLHALLFHPLVKATTVYSLAGDILNTNDIPKRTQAYCTKTFGWSKAEWMNSNSGVADYCAKYVTKGNDYFYLGEPRSWV